MLSCPTHMQKEVCFVGGMSGCPQSYNFRRDVFVQMHQIDLEWQCIFLIAKFLKNSSPSVRAAPVKPNQLNLIQLCLYDSHIENTTLFYSQWHLDCKFHCQVLKHPVGSVFLVSWVSKDN